MAEKSGLGKHTLGFQMCIFGFIASSSVTLKIETHVYTFPVKIPLVI